MVLKFIPYEGDADKGTLQEKVDVLMDAAQKYKAEVLDVALHSDATDALSASKLTVPREMKIAYNWEEIARLLREIRELPELSPLDKAQKSALLFKLAEIYEVLRTAKMPKLEAVRLALISEASELKGGSSAEIA